MGTRRALFPNQRLAPLLNVVGIVMLVGMLPGIFQFATEQLFVDPQILAVRPISADLLPAFDAESTRSKHVLLLGRDPRLHVKTKSAQTSSIEICCDTDPDNCTGYTLEHSLIQFDEKPAILEIPAAASTRCNLTARGLSKKSFTTLDLMVAVKAIKNLCDCRKSICSCCNGYLGELDAEGEEAQKMLATDFCTPAPCGIDNSNRKPGPECNCSIGYVGDIVWEAANVSGSCTPAPCYVEDSNRKPGLECRCRDGFAGEVHWEGSEASGTCLPATCGSIPYSTGAGRDCKCMDGYDGEIRWNRSQPFGSCVAAAGCADKVANSTGEGLQCKCKDGFAGKILWQGPVPQGSCQAAECRIENSNLQPGPGCRCRDGHQGDINWSGDRVTGRCTPAPCAVANSVGEGLQCKCKDGFTGSIRWHGSVPQGSCQAAECHVENSNEQPGLGCKCKAAYKGNIRWQGDRVGGACMPAPCMIPHSLGLGPECACRDGFAGEIIWHDDTPRGQCIPASCANIPHTTGHGMECACRDGFYGTVTWSGASASGECKPAPCETYGSNLKDGPACRCLEGFDGSIDWDGPRLLGSCVPLACYGHYSNRRAGPECGCLDAFNGSRTRREVPGQRVPSHFWADCHPAECSIENSNMRSGPRCACLDGYEGSIRWKGPWESGECLPAPCNIHNSNYEPGRGCKCQDGFLGAIAWTGPLPSGSCRPAPCNILGSNLEPGRGCRCKDGFQGNITWNGSSATGACEPVPCRVLHSDHALGTSCRCLQGFYGHIVWRGPTFSGTCVPRPLCRLGDAFHVTRLLAGLLDTNNDTCQAGQFMLVHGHTEWVDAKSRLRWSSAKALPPARCKVEWPEAHYAVKFNNPDPEHFSLTSWCAATPGQPLCSSQIVYTVTTRNTSHYACDACKTLEPALTEFRGRRCGYDLIKWESFTISPGSFAACTCDLSLSCSEVPAEELPRACIHYAEPAVLSLARSVDENDAGKDVVGLYKFYEAGDLLLTRSADGPEEADRLGAESADHTWLSDGENVLSIGPHNTDLWVGRTAGSHFILNGSVLSAPTALPEWWKVKFKQEAALPGSFNTDKLAGCEFVFKTNSSCYSARLGQGVWVAPPQEDHQEDCVFEDDATADSSIAYRYRSSAFGLQTYRSKEACYPTAAFEEILVQVVDVGMSTEDLSYTISSSPCRTVIRYMVDARSKLSECHSFFKPSAS
ncbi:dlc [Symbiodinium sp. CCMP2592]|nr:dlc [Symbiodinium sp. CCMP2592]